jgi:hypothetical protein
MGLKMTIILMCVMFPQTVSMKFDDNFAIKTCQVRVFELFLGKDLFPLTPKLCFGSATIFLPKYFSLLSAKRLILIILQASSKPGV